MLTLPGATLPKLLCHSQLRNSCSVGFIGSPCIQQLVCRDHSMHNFFLGFWFWFFFFQKPFMWSRQEGRQEEIILTLLLRVLDYSSPQNTRPIWQCTAKGSTAGLSWALFWVTSGILGSVCAGCTNPALCSALGCSLHPAEWGKWFKSTFLQNETTVTNKTLLPKHPSPDFSKFISDCTFWFFLLFTELRETYCICNYFSPIVHSLDVITELWYVI